MVAAIPKNSGASAWENSECPSCGHADVDEDFAICPECETVLPRPVVADDGTWRLVKGFRSSSYRRMHPDCPATTVTTANGRIGSSSTIHPSQNRVLSALECAHLQTLPENFNWGAAPLSTIGVDAVRAMIGEAVPPKFTEAHGLVIKACLSGDRDTGLLSASDSRCTQANSILKLFPAPS